MTTRKLVWSTALVGLLFSLPALVATAEGQEFASPANANEAPARPCSLATLNGSFGFFANVTMVAALPGFPPPPLEVVSSGIINYDGTGNLTGESTTNFNGLITTSGTFTGTYTVNPDCTYSGQHTSSTGMLHFDGAVSGSGMLQEIHFVITNPGLVGYGTDKRIPPGGCSLSTLKGSYSLFGQGMVTAYTPPALIAHTGMLTYDGAGNLSGHDTISLNGTTVPDTFTGTYTVDANCTVSVEITSTAVGVIHELGRITGEGKSQEVHLIITDPGFVAVDATRKQ